MEKVCKKLGAILVVLCVVSVLANYFNVLAIPATVVNVTVGVFIGFVAMMGTYHYEPYDDFNPVMWWFIYSAMSGALLLVIFYMAGFGLIDKGISISILTGLSPLLIPVIGIFLGDCGRILLKTDGPVI